MGYTFLVQFLVNFCSKTLAQLSKKLEQLFLLSLRNPKILTVLLLLSTLLLAGNLSKLKFLFSAEDMVGEGIPSADELLEMKERYSEGTSSILWLLPAEKESSFTIKELCAIRKWYSISRLSNGNLKNTVSTFDLKWPVKVGASAVKYQNILQLNCDALTATNELAEVKKVIDSAPWPGLRDKKDRFSLVFSFNYLPSDDSKFGSFDPRVVKEIRDSAETDLRAIVPKAQMHWVGTADYQWYVREGFRFTFVVNSAMILVLLLSLRFLYGTWLSGLLFCLSLLVTAIWIYGAKALFGSAYDVMASGIFLILGVSALEDFTFLSSEQLKGMSWRESLQTFLVPSFFTSLTTIIGFLSLLSSDLGMIRRFGVWCAAGALLEWTMLFLFLPAVLSFFPHFHSWVNPRKSRGHFLTMNWSQLAPPRWLCRFLLLAIPISFFLFPRLNANDSPTALFPKTHPYRIGLQEMVEGKGWQSVVSLFMNAPGEVPFSLLKEIQTSNAGKNVIATEDAGTISQWLSAKNVLPQETISLDYRSSLNFKQLTDPDGFAKANLYIKNVNVADLQSLKSEINKLCGEKCHAGGDLIAYSDFATMIPKTLLDSMAMSLILVAAVVGFLAFAFQQQRQLPALLASAFWGPCLILIILILCKVPMDFLKCIFASVLVGLTGDNAIQYLFASKNNSLSVGIHQRGSASIQTNSIMALTALMYLGSYFDPPKSFGIILASGLAVALIGDLWILNGLLPKTKKSSLSDS